MAITDFVKKFFNIFEHDEKQKQYLYIGQANAIPGDTHFRRIANERTIIAAIYTRIAIDASSIAMKHIVVDDEDRYLSTKLDSQLNNMFNYEANIDQTGKDFLQNIVANMLDDGYAVVVPVDTKSYSYEGAFEIYSARLGKIVEWFPKHIKVEVYDEKEGIKKQLILPKQKVAIFKNPFFNVLNDRNSTLQRLLKKLNQLDIIDNKIGSGKIDMVVQTPYPIKSEKRLKTEQIRRADWENQMQNNQYGIIQIDGTEKITQLNRPLENNLQQEVEYLTNLLYSQTSMSPELLANKANEMEVYYYLQRTIEPILSTITTEINRKFISKKAYYSGERLMYFMEPLKLVPIGEIAKIADVFSRNEIMTPNELRQKIGLRPLDNPSSDEVGNRNMPMEDQDNQMNPEMEQQM